MLTVSHVRFRRYFYAGILVLSVPMIMYLSVTIGHNVKKVNAFKRNVNIVNSTVVTIESEAGTMTTRRFLVSRSISNKTIKTAEEFWVVSPSLKICSASQNLLGEKLF